MVAAGPALLPGNNAAQAAEASSTAARGQLAETPGNVPAILQRIIDSRNGADCETRIDFNSLTESFCNEALPYLNSAVASGKIRLEGPLPMLLTSLNSSQPMARMGAVMMLGAEVRKFTLYGVNSGSFAGSPLPKEQLDQLDGGLFASMGSVSTARKEFRGGKPLSQDGGKAEVATTLFDHGSRKAYNVTLGLEKRDSKWVVTSIRNVESLLDSLFGDSSK